MLDVIYSWLVHNVQTGTRAVITNGGAIEGIQNEGRTFVAPWKVLNTFSVSSETTDVDKAAGSTIDTQPVHISLTVRYNIYPDQVAKVFESFSKNGDMSSYVTTATQEVVKAVTAQYVAPDLIAKRSEVSTKMFDALQAKLTKYGVHVNNIDMRNFEFDPSYMAQINLKAEQDQKLQLAEKKLKTVESEQKQIVAIAEAGATAAKATADGQAYAKVAAATAEAKALQLQGQAISTSPEILELRRIEVDKIRAERWGGEYPQIMGGSAQTLQTLDLNQIMGARKAATK